jgi:glutathione peroxidase
MFASSSVKGKSANPLFAQLAKATGKEPGWNFNKYLVDRRGRVAMRFPSSITPDAPEMTRAVNALLAEKA